MKSELNSKLKLRKQLWKMQTILLLKLCFEKQRNREWWLARKWGRMCVVAKSRLTLCDPMDCSLPSSPVHRILQARILKWVAISSSRQGGVGIL